VIDGREVTLDGEHDDWSLLKLAVTDIADQQFIVDVGGVSPNFYSAQALRL
jgi:hypothetical protein